MQFYKATIKLNSPLATLLKGDTIWGHIVWGIANHEGDEAVKKFLDESKSAEPPLIVSSAFPKDSICKPYPKHVDRKENLSKKDYAQIKASKKQKYVSASDFFTGAEQKEEFKGLKKVSSMHNGINRFSNTVEEGNLFSSTELWASPKESDFDLYLFSSYSAERVKQLLDWAFENGFGADSSTGKGAISVEKIQKVEVQEKKSNKYVALAPFVLEKSDIKEDSLRADVFVRTGKIGGAFATYMTPYKKTVILFDEGAVFESDKPLEFVGKLLTDIHADPRICQAGFAPVVPFLEAEEE